MYKLLLKKYMFGKMELQDDDYDILCNQEQVNFIFDFDEDFDYNLDFINLELIFFIKEVN